MPCHAMDAAWDDHNHNHLKDKGEDKDKDDDREKDKDDDKVSQLASGAGRGGKQTSKPSKYEENQLVSWQGEGEGKG